MTLIDGKAVAASIRSELAIRSEKFEAIYGRRPGLAVILVGNDPASQVYVRNKIKGCQEAGIRSFSHHLSEDAAQEQVISLVKSLANDDAVDGILVQLPLPKHLNVDQILRTIPAKKDADGFSEMNMGLLAQNRKGTVACTPLGIMELLKRYEIPVRGKNAVVVGRSNIVGRPMALLLLNADATVTVCHSRTQNLREECARADILIAAVGRAKLIKADMVKEGAVVIDVGMNRDEKGNLCGDVDFDAVIDKVSFITPVPGGVGPMTIAMLLRNTCDAAERRMQSAR